MSTFAVTSILLQPFRLHDLTLPNRIALAPMTRGRAGAARLPNPLMAEYYAQRSSAGLLVTEATTISEEANGWNETPGIYTDEMTAGWKHTTNAVHENGGMIFLQLWHTGRASHSSFHGGKPAVAPSALKINEPEIHTPTGKQPHEVPRALETSEIPRIVEDYRQAAERAKQANFDGVELHSANAYLMDEFLQSKTNRRTDEYGRSVENRYRFLKEVIEAVTSVWPAHRVGVRLSPNAPYNDMGSSDFREQFTFVASQLDRFGLAYLHVVDGLEFGFHKLGEPMTLAEFRKVFHGPLMGNCGYTQETAVKAIAEGHADLISFGRPFISNPDLVERFRNGWPLAEPAPISDWSSPSGAKGYTNFPPYGLVSRSASMSDLPTSTNCPSRRNEPMKNRKKKIQSAAVTIALLTAAGTSIRAQSESSREAAGDVAKPQTSSPTDFVDTLNSIFGKQTTQRATHAKGIIVQGQFKPAQAAQGLSKAPHFRQAVPVTVRFSDNTGIPTLPDADDHATPHGMALKFHLPDGSETDLVTHSFNGFPAATGDEMRQFLIAIGSSGTGVSSPTPLDTFLAAHPAAKTFVTTQDPPPVSYATLAYFGVNSFRFTNTDGKVTVGRYQIIPKAGKHFLSKEEVAKAAPDYLTSELRSRLAKAPIRFDFRLQLAESNDKIDNPSITWSDKNKTVNLGVIEITSIVPDSDLTQRALLFLPGLLPVGIEPADPMIQFRNKAYPISYDRRHAGETKE